MVLAFKIDFGVFQTDIPDFGRDLRALKARVWDFDFFSPSFVCHSQLCHRSPSIYVCQGFKGELPLVPPHFLALAPSFIAPRWPAASRPQDKCQAEPSPAEAHLIEREFPYF